MNKDDTLPPEVQAVIDDLRTMLTIPIWGDREKIADLRESARDHLRAYDASRAPKYPMARYITVSDVVTLEYDDGSKIVLVHPAECERRVAAADRKAREECARILDDDGRAWAADIVRASIKP